MRIESFVRWSVSHLSEGSDKAHDSTDGYERHPEDAAKNAEKCDIAAARFLLRSHDSGCKEEGGQRQAQTDTRHDTRNGWTDRQTEWKTDKMKDRQKIRIARKRPLKMLLSMWYNLSCLVFLGKCDLFCSVKSLLGKFLLFRRAWSSVVIMISLIFLIFYLTNVIFLVSSCLYLIIVISLVVLGLHWWKWSLFSCSDFLVNILYSDRPPWLLQEGARHRHTHTEDTHKITYYRRMYRQTRGDRWHERKSEEEDWNIVSFGRQE